MPGILDAQPFWSHRGAWELREVLATAYWQPTAVIELAERVGIPRYRLPMLEGTVYQLWGGLLEYARDAAKLNQLLQEVLADAEKSTYHARISELLDDQPVLAAPSPQDTADRPEKPWVGFDDRDQLERIIADTSTLLDISFLRKGLEVGAAVARITTSFPSGRLHGTAFRIGENLLLTNHHVLFDWDNHDKQADIAELWFGYERDFTGRTLTHRQTFGDTGTIVGDKTHDWAAIKSREPLGVEDSILSLDPTVSTEVGERVYIVQHPDGQPKQIGLHHNLVRHVDDDVIQYWTDTKAGSSGSPVFNDRWQVVAIHHRWVPIELGHQAQREFRNQGRRISRVWEGLQAHGLVD